MNREKTYIALTSALCLLPGILSMVGLVAVPILVDSPSSFHEMPPWQEKLIGGVGFLVFVSFVLPFVAFAMGLKRTARLAYLLAVGNFLAIVLPFCAGPRM